jgi:hypothetical protein
MNRVNGLKQFISLRAEIDAERERLERRLLDINSALGNQPDPKPIWSDERAKPYRMSQQTHPPGKSNRKMSPEAKARISFVQRRRWARKKAELKANPAERPSARTQVIL